MVVTVQRSSIPHASAHAYVCTRTRPHASLPAQALTLAHTPIHSEKPQDSKLLGKIQQALVRRVLRFLNDRAQKEPDAYKKWFNEVHNTPRTLVYARRVLAHTRVRVRVRMRMHA